MRIFAFARTIRCASVSSATRNARAISPVVSPPTRRRVSATCASGESAGWQHVKISESRSSGIVSLVHRFLRLLLQLGDELGQAPLAAQAVDRLAPRGDREPRAGARGNPGARPRDERSRQRVLERVFRKVDVAQVADQRRDDAPVLGAEDRLDGAYITQTGRTSIEPCSAAGIFAAYCSASSMFSHSRT